MGIEGLGATVDCSGLLLSSAPMGCLSMRFIHCVLSTMLSTPEVSHGSPEEWSIVDLGFVVMLEVGLVRVLMCSFCASNRDWVLVSILLSFLPMAGRTSVIKEPRAYNNRNRGSNSE